MLPTVAVAEELRLDVVRPLAGGEFGATLVRNASGEELILKLLASDRLLAAASRGAGLANRLRLAGYPAPEYLGTGTSEGCTWTLQRVLRGRVPDVMTAAHAQALLALAESHTGFAEDTFDWQTAAIRKTRRSLETPRPVAPALVAELEHVVERSAGVELRRGDVVHSDFHHRNFLAEGEHVTGVFDWEVASPGDWRFDLVTLAFWTSIVPAGSSEEARSLVQERVASVCDPDTLAFLAAVLAARQLEFDARVHPERVHAFQAALERTVADWWRSGIQVTD